MPTYERQSKGAGPAKPRAVGSEGRPALTANTPLLDWPWLGYVES